jgi:Cu(I)/Ag(I) efflux system membrane fusion protein
VQLGARSDDYVEVLKGVKNGERVVVAANFLIDAESNLKAAVGGFGTPPQTQAPPPQAASGVGHHGVGTVDSVDVKAGTVHMNHEAIASLKWPAMTMEFHAANEALLKDLRPGTRVEFEFVERKPGEWVITSIRRAAAAPVHKH